MPLRHLSVACLALCLAAPAPAADLVDFETQIRPLFTDRCIGCHGAEKQKGKLRLDQRSAVLAEGKKLAVAGDPAASEIFRRISLPADDDDRMPAKGKPLTPEQITLVKTWIEEGARWPEAAPTPHMVDFKAQIWPILERSCVSCHGPDKQKGKLRLDDRDDVFRERKTLAIKPGDPKASELYHRVSLPADDLDIMPNEGDPLSTEEIALIRVWIEEGAFWPSGVVKPPRPIEKITLPTMTDAQKAAEKAARAAIQARGGLALPVAQDTAAAYVNFSLLGDQLTDDDLKLLRGLEPNLVWLNLARTGISDRGLHRLGDFPQLRRLNLSRTRAGDEAVRAAAGLSHLEYLNLYGAHVTDAGIAHLRSLTGLRKLFLWQTQVTDAGIDALQGALPDLVIDRGDALALLPPPPEKKAEKKPEVKPEKQPEKKAEPKKTNDAKPVAKLPACCQKAQDAGKECTHACCVKARAEDKICEKCAGN